LKGEFFVSGDSQKVPGMDRRLEAFCKKYGRFRPKFHGPAQSLAHGFELVANENAVQILPAFASHHSLPGVVILPLADAEVTWNILVIWRRGRAGGALKALLDAALFTKVTPKANEAKRLRRHGDSLRRRRPNFHIIAGSSCSKGSKCREIASGAMPIPESQTWTCRNPDDRSALFTSCVRKECHHAAHVPRR
jgi:hypothetical protein